MFAVSNILYSYISISLSGERGKCIYIDTISVPANIQYSWIPGLVSFNQVIFSFLLHPTDSTQRAQYFGAETKFAKCQIAKGKIAEG